MKRLYFKLIATSLLLLTAMAIVVSASYAWFVLSESPAVSGIQVAISGGQSILIAADLTETVDGVTYHYPDKFSDTLSFGQHESYEYLSELGGLRPVSTADGQNWFLTTYYGTEDEEVLSGKVTIGSSRPVSEYLLDSTLEYANIPAGETEKLSAGHYIYMDFWVVSPGANYKLRISSGDGGGSFVIDLLQPTQSDDGYTLAENASSTSASVRVGFLTTEQMVSDNSMLYYQSSRNYDDRYTSLRGVFNEPGRTTYTYTDYLFTIYEPNGDSHPGGAAADGAYLATYPVGYDGETVTNVSVLNRTSVQLASKWSDAPNGAGLLIEQIFQTALLQNNDYATTGNAFYTDYLQGQLAAYITAGEFVTRSGGLTDMVSSEIMSQTETSGATDDVYIIELERNVPQRIRMYIWLEGQDADWNPNDAAASFAMNIELAGGTD